MARLLAPSEYSGNVPKQYLYPLPWLRDRETFLNSPPSSRGTSISRTQREFSKRLYFLLKPITDHHWRHKSLPGSSCRLHSGHGAVFNLEFSPDGKSLAAACENASIRLCDPHNLRWTNVITDAHSESTNLIRYLSDTTFASCSDDKTVALWDARNLSKCYRRLKGHTHWVKNIEYLQEKSCLLTSGFDGTVLAWDLNRSKEKSESSDAGGNFTKIISMDGLCRMALTPCGTQMIIGSINGFIAIIHDLHIDSLPQARMAQHLQHVFDGNLDALCNLAGLNTLEEELKRNRFEIVTTFHPDEHKSWSWCISSLAVHPQSWCLAARFSFDRVPSDNQRPVEVEGTCVLDIQEPMCGPSRLNYYIAEPHVGLGYIKEISFTPDGRLLCSPFGNGVRLLAFNKSLDEICDQPPDENPLDHGSIHHKSTDKDSDLSADSNDKPNYHSHTQSGTSNPKKLLELKTLVSHTKPVVCAKFSPINFTLATGCLDGKLAFYKPHGC